MGMAHPNRSKTKPASGSNPTPAEIRAAREKAGLTKPAAAELIYGSLRAWEDWEAEGDTNRRMHPGLFELFQIKTGQHRQYGIKE